MRLMKKNTSNNNISNRLKPTVAMKFDWTKITEKNSSVHS